MSKKKATPELPLERPNARVYAKPDHTSYKMLSVKMRAFCVEMINPNCPGAVEAVIVAYGKKKSPERAKILARDLLRKDSIRATIRRLRDEQATMANLTPKSITTRVDRLAREAMQDGDRALALKALQVLGKWMGMDKEGEMSLSAIAGAAAAGAAAGSEMSDAIREALTKSKSVIDV
jgi:hypothetical protein